MKTPNRLGFVFRTANEGPALRLSALITPNAPNIANLRNDEWYLISPFGEFPSPDRTYTQVFTRDQADRIVATWNSITGKAFRFVKNSLHKFFGKISTPVFDGHPETNKQLWPTERLLAETTDLRVTGNGLEGKLTWNAKGMERRTRGPLYPSPLWWHMPPDAEHKVFPELLESIGLVPTPNIASVPSWTQNASPEAEEKTTNEETNIMKDKLLKLLGLGAEATEDQIIGGVESLQKTANSSAETLKTANAAKEKAEGEIATANQSVATIAKERDGLKTSNAAAATLNGQLADGILDVFEKTGKITAAQRAEWKPKFTANGADIPALVKELTEKKDELNTKSLELNGNRIDISTANARQGVINEAVSKLMKEEKIPYNEAYARVQKDPKFAQVFAAMADPTKPAKAA